MNKDIARSLQKQIDNGELVFDRDRIRIFKTEKGMKSLLDEYLEKKARVKK